MAEHHYRPVPHDAERLLEEARRKPGFPEAYDGLKEEFSLVRELLTARKNAGLSQQEVAEAMGTTKSAISRLESGTKHSPSMRTLDRYARAVGCRVQIKLVPSS